MKISYHNITPAPLAGVVSKDSDIWGTEVTFQKGTSYLVYAPSGKGKSTFAHVMYGLRNDYTGKATIDGTNTQEIKAARWAQLRQQELSIVFQDLRLFLDLTAWDNLLVKANLYPNVKELEEEMRHMADILGISHVLDKKAALMSYGERQRTAIIRALIQPYSFLLLDEPFSHLDEGNIEKAAELIWQRTAQQGASLLMTSLGYEYDLSFDQKLLLG